MKKSTMKLITSLSLGCALSLNAHAAVELKPLTYCSMNLMGDTGPTKQFQLDYETAAVEWGVKIKYKSYPNEKIIAEELKAGVCDVALLLDAAASKFNLFTGTIGAAGAIPTYDHLQTVLKTLSKPSAGKYMVSGDYEVIGIQPGGFVYLFTRDRSIRSLSDLAGKKAGILDNMPELAQLVTDNGMIPVASSATNLFQKFNNGAIDVTGGPALVYDMMEVENGLEPNGGILEQPIGQITMQLVARSSVLPEGFGQKSRQYVYSYFDSSLKMITAAKESIPAKWWFPILPEYKDQFHSEMKKTRVSFLDKGLYHPKALTLLRKVRCKYEPTLAECTSKDAE